MTSRESIQKRLAEAVEMESSADEQRQTLAHLLALAWDASRNRVPVRP